MHVLKDKRLCRFQHVDISRGLSRPLECRDAYNLTSIAPTWVINSHKIFREGEMARYIINLDVDQSISQGRSALKGLR
jgi:hypothetical protein